MSFFKLMHRIITVEYSIRFENGGILFMADNRFIGGSACTLNGRDICCIETDRIYDSCRDRDCYENVQVFLSDYGREIINRTGNIRAKDACIAWTYINVDSVRFNRGFYTVNIRYFIKIVFEACIGNNKAQEFEGIAVIDKKVVLFGGEKHISIFKSIPDNCNFCNKTVADEFRANLPKAVIEATEPIILDVKILEKAHSIPECLCCCCDIPETVLCQLQMPVSETLNDCDRFLVISLGIFSVIRLVRPAQLIVNATEYCVPDKECVVPREDNPCAIFNSMAFPTSEFCTSIPSNVINCSGKCN